MCMGRALLGLLSGRGGAGAALLSVARARLVRYGQADILDRGSVPTAVASSCNAKQFLEGGQAGWGAVAQTLNARSESDSNPCSLQ